MLEQKTNPKPTRSRIFSDGFSGPGSWDINVGQECHNKRHKELSLAVKNASLVLTSSGTTCVIGWSNNAKYKLNRTVLSLQQLGTKNNPQTAAERKLKYVCVCVCVSKSDWDFWEIWLTQIHDGRPQQQGHRHSFLVMNFLAANKKTTTKITVYKYCNSNAVCFLKLFKPWL